MKQVWFAELQLLEKFIDICNKHGLSYQLVGGSLLGAIRHKGFIPWDDDIDVGMLRPDYDRFVQLAKNELEAPFFLQTPLTDPGRNIDYVQIRNSATTAIDLRYVDDHNTFNQGIFIDIFPIDGVGSDEVLQKQEKQQQFIRRVYGKIRWKLTETSREAGGNIGYAISRQYRGHGYGTILLKSLIDIAKSGNCPELLATVKKYNYASKRVMEKCSGELVRETDERWYYRLG